MDTDRCRLGGTAADRTAMPSSSVMSRCRAMSRAVDSVAVAVRPSKHRTPNRSLSTYEHAVGSSKGSSSAGWSSGRGGGGGAEEGAEQVINTNTSQPMCSLL
ncbi:hypothetical protein EYF80_042391 [Liparis tanakae]|uniref:Uncharacterized protein n=1 Tax=Liparis tanakae TaxID=230148 RepID=A0A4Z2G1G9_9TELE|nr:hypothetical protein EYF80_042391 [Liparis tanakae]